MYCENCGARIDDDSRFCENCGALVADPDPEDYVEEDAQALTDLEQLMEMEKTEEPEEATERTGLDQTMVFVKPERRGDDHTYHSEPKEAAAFEMETPGESDTEDKGEEEKPAISYGLSDDDMEIPDALKPEGDSPLFWPAQPERGSWDAEDEWEEEADWKAEQPEPDFKEDAEPLAMSGSEAEESDAFENDADSQEDEDSEAEGGFFSRTGLGAALKSKFRTEPEEKLAEETEAWENEQEEAPEENSDSFETETSTEPWESPAPEAPEEAWNEGQAFESASSSDERKEDQEEAPLFCMACGKRLPQGAAFCDACGTPTGEVAPRQPRRKRVEPGMVLEIVKHIFVKPIGTIEKAASENAFTAGIGFFILKDVILAVVAAALTGRLTATLGIAGTWIAGGDPFGFGAKVFLCGVVADAVWLALLYAAGRLFQGECSLKELTGACGAANIFGAILMLIAVILLAVSLPVGTCAAMIAAAISVISMTTAVESALTIDRERKFYLIAAVTALYFILIFLAAMLLF